jgi:hypothetical protein
VERLRYMADHTTPTLEEVERIRNLPDPVMRNLWITQCYHELSAFLSGDMAPAANWCTFATWASKQAGQTIRKEDLERLLERCLNQTPSMIQGAQNVTAVIDHRVEAPDVWAQNPVLDIANFTSAIERTSAAVGRGNKKVFEEIGYEFARFHHVCFAGQALDVQTLPQFYAGLRSGNPPEGQDCLRQAFTHYAAALVETSLKARAELVYLANLEIGLHEQTRLQPEIAESMDAVYISFLEYSRALFRRIFPLHGWFHLAQLYLMRLLGRPTALDLAIQALLADVRVQLRRAITELMMSITLPSGIVLRLGQDVPADFPVVLKDITNAELVAFLKKHGLSPNGAQGSGAVDWADLPERMKFILGLFRCYQEHQGLFEAPFTTDQVVSMQKGDIPPGRL